MWNTTTDSSCTKTWVLKEGDVAFTEDSSRGRWTPIVPWIVETPTEILGDHQRKGQAVTQNADQLRDSVS